MVLYSSEENCYILKLSVSKEKTTTTKNKQNKKKNHEFGVILCRNLFSLYRKNENKRGLRLTSNFNIGKIQRNAQYENNWNCRV